MSETQKLLLARVSSFRGKLALDIVESNDCGDDADDLCAVDELLAACEAALSSDGGPRPNVDDALIGDKTSSRPSSLVARGLRSDHPTSPSEVSLESSAAVAQDAVNVLVAGSNPASTATFTDAHGIAWFERTFGVPLGDMPGARDVARVRAAAVPRNAVVPLGKPEHTRGTWEASRQPSSGFP